MIKLSFIAFLSLTFVALTACDTKQSAEKQSVVSNIESHYVGAEKCQSCHVEQAQEWKQSDHFQAMRVADSRSVLGNFTNRTELAHDVKYKFSKEGDVYWVEISEAHTKKKYKVSYTFGYTPLQQYLIEFDNGHLQALNMAWDSRSDKEGGQRWFHLRPDEVMSKDNIFHWQRHYQNWNSRCADCHSTGFEKKYSQLNHRYKSQWSDINVACEACHGEGSQHVALAEQDKLNEKVTGFITSTQSSLDWFFREGESIASPVKTNNTQSDSIDMCGRCHSLRSLITEQSSLAGYHDQNRLQLLDNNLYHPDGQIKEETFVLGSFLQSKMYSKGVTCANCHNPHSGKILIKGDGLCLQCHKATSYQSTLHHRHQQGTAASECVSCHMPTQTYMQVDARRDHSFTVPNAMLSTKLGAPNACVGCHQNQKNGWLQGVFNDWQIKNDENHWAMLKHELEINDQTHLVNVRALLDSGQPVMRSATLLFALGAVPSQQNYELAKSQLQNSAPLIRRAALSSMHGLPVTVRQTIGLKYLGDKSRAVRFEALTLLLPEYSQLSNDQITVFIDVLSEYEAALMLSADTPEGQLAIAAFKFTQGDFLATENAYQHALKIEPNHILGLINLADFYRATNRDSLGRILLEKALTLEPNHSSANFAYGMALVRDQNKRLAMDYLQRATQQDEGEAYYHYVYAVALNDRGNRTEALLVLERALLHWPSEQRLLVLIKQFKEKLN